MESKKCKHCGKEFTGNKKKIFCSDLCRKYAHEKKNISIVKTYIENKAPTIEILSDKFPGVPDRLLKRANKIFILKNSMWAIDHPKAREVVELEILRLEDIMELEMELEDWHPSSDEAKKIQEQLQPLLEKEKILYAKRKERLKT